MDFVRAALTTALWSIWKAEPEQSQNLQTMACENIKSDKLLNLL